MINLGFWFAYLRYTLFSNKKCDPNWTYDPFVNMLAYASTFRHYLIILEASKGPDGEKYGRLSIFFEAVEQCQNYWDAHNMLMVWAENDIEFGMAYSRMIKLLPADADTAQIKELILDFGKLKGIRFISPDVRDRLFELRARLDKKDQHRTEDFINGLRSGTNPSGCFD